MKINKAITTFFPFFGILFFLTACERNIEITLPAAEEKIVVEGWIDLNDYATVILTKNLPYFGTVDSSMLTNLIVHNATVIVSDGTTTDTLSEILNLEYFPPFIYKGSKIKGEAGKTYDLTIKAGNKTLTAQTTIPKPVPLDSVWFKAEASHDSLGYLWAKFTDPPETGQCYRIFTKRVNKDNSFIPLLGSVFEDKFFNGQSFNFSMMRGIRSYISKEEDPEMGFFKIGDQVIVKECVIDKAHYDFWRTAEDEIISGNNPFTNPTKLISNIKGGGLGVWGGYSCTFDTVIIK